MDEFYSKSNNYVSKSTIGIICLIFILGLLAPRINILSLDSSESVFRLDTLLFIIFGCIFALVQLLVLRLSKFEFLFFGFVIYTLFINFLSGMIIIGGGVAIIYLSFLGCFWLGRNIQYYNNDIFFKYFNGFVLLNVYLHLIGFWGSRFISPDLIILKYGIFNLPYNFCLSISLGVVLMLYRRSISNLQLIMVCMAIFSGDSRISLVFLLPIIFFKKKDNILIESLIIMFFSVCIFILNSILNLKTISTVNVSLATDTSLAMRIFNYYNYLDWVNDYLLIFGGGAMAFLQFSTQYGLPGPLDSLPLRLISEYGIVGIILFTLPFIIPVFRSLISINKDSFNLLILLSSIFVYSLLNEGIMGIKSGHIFFFVIGYLITVKRVKTIN